MNQLPAPATLADLQAYIERLEARHGWTEVDLVHNCFLMGEEVGELFKAVRKHLRMFEEPGAGAAPGADARAVSVAHVAEEIVDVLNYLLAIANRLDIDLDGAFRDKNSRNESRVWS